MYQLVKFQKRLFNRLTDGIYRTPPLRCDPSSSFVVLSQTYHADMNLYLVAAKSFARYLRPRHFVVVDDGLTESDRELLQQHLGEARFVRTADVDVGSCPRGGTWERLATIASVCKDHYVVQLDSDTVTRAHPDEVQRCIEANLSFTLGTSQGQCLVAAEEASRFAAQHAGTHVQIVAERALKDLPDAASTRYVRGCSGFAGFSRGSIDMGALQRASTLIEPLVGADKWREWGSEQVASNFLIANSPRAMVLPLSEYVNWSPRGDADAARFLHFIGDHRFKRWHYLGEARRVIVGLT